jgi:hypothetical protein
MAKGHAEDAVKVLAEVMNDKGAPPNARVNAANSLIDRGYGKPTQMITGPGGNGEHAITVITRRIIDPATNAD